MIADSRERQPLWEAKEYEDFIVKRQKLDAADYSIEGLENLIRIERKKCGMELYANFTKHRERFYKEVERLREIPHKFIVIESTLEEISNPLSYRAVGNYNRAPAIVLSSLVSLSLLDGIQIIYAGKSARGIIKRIFNKFSEYCTKGIIK